MASDTFEYKTSGISSSGPRGSSLNLDEAQGIVECFVAGIGNKDSVGDIVSSGAFTKSLMRRKPRVVWGHSWNDPIGKVLEIYEVPTTDPRLPMKMKMAGIGGLFARVQFNLNSEKGREAFANVAFFGEEQEWSIGYKTLRAQYDQKAQANVIYELELYEVSPVLHGANSLTGTISIKTDTMESTDIYELNQVDREEMQKQLSMMYGPKTLVLNADRENVTFARPGENGGMEKYKCGYSRSGTTFMFGAPQRIVAPQVVSPQSMPTSVPVENTPHPHRTVIRPQQMPAIPVAIKPNPIGPGTVMVPLPPVQYENENKPVDKNNLDKEESDLRDAIRKVVARHGRFNEDSTGVWAGYKPPENNPVAGIGVKCANCVFYKGGSSCEVISLPVHPEGKCRFAIIPDGVVKGDYGDKKSVEEDFLEQQEDYLMELEVKYPGELLLAGLRGAVGRFKKKKRKRKFKDLSEYDENEIDEKGYCVSVSPEDAFGVKNLLDPIIDYYGVESFVDVQGIIFKSGVSYDFIEAVDTAISNHENIKKKLLDDDVEVKNLGRRLASYGASRLIDRPRLGGGRGRGARGFGVPEGDLNPDTRVDKNRNGWLFDNIPGWEQRDPTPYGPGSIYNADLTPDQLSDSRQIGPEGKPLTGAKPKDFQTLPYIPEPEKNPYKPSKKPDKVWTGPAKIEDSGKVVPLKAKPNEQRRLSSGRNLSRHGRGKAHEQKFGVSRDEQKRREDFDKIAQTWIDSKMGWTEVPRQSTDKDESENLLRGRELGFNQSRVAWLGTGKGNGKRPDSFNEKAKSSTDYANWYMAYVGHLGNFISAINSKENKNTPDDKKDYNAGIRQGISEQVFAKMPDTATWQKEDSENLSKWMKSYGFDPQKKNDGRLSSGWMMEPENRGRTVKIPGLDDDFDADNPYGDANAPYDLGFDVYDKIIEEFLGEEQLPETSKRGRKPVDDVSFADWSDEEIYKKRMGGMTLDEVATEMGIDRREVRQRELRHMSKMREMAKAKLSPKKKKQFAKLSDDANEQIYEDRISGMSNAEVAKKYNIPKKEAKKRFDDAAQEKRNKDFVERTRTADEKAKRTSEEQAKRQRDEEGYLSSGADGDESSALTPANKKLNELGPLGFVISQLPKKRQERLSSGATLSGEELQKKYDALAVQIIESIQKAIKNPNKPWRRPWASIDNYARNITNRKWNPDGRAYEGENQFILSMTGFAKKYKTNKWAGAAQWAKLGGKIKPGEEKNFTSILAPDYEDGRKVPGKFHETKVWNVAQISGLPKAIYEQTEKDKLTDAQRMETMQAVIKEINPDFEEGNFGGAFYNVGRDTIFMPKFGQFDNPIDFYATMLHEMTHWTSHPSRLNRVHGRMSAPRYSEEFKKYAFEELIAEMGSSLMMGMLGHEPKFRDDHGQYLQSWMDTIKEDPTAVRRALAEAQKAVDYMLNRSPTMRRMLGMAPEERKVNADLRLEIPMLEGMEDAPKLKGPGKIRGTFEMLDETDERLSSGKIEDFAKRPFKKGKTHNIGTRGWRAVDRENGDREVYHYSTMMGLIRDGKYYQVSEGWGSVSDKQGIKKILRALGQDSPEPMENIQAVDRLSSGKIEQFGTRPHVPGKISFAGSNRAWKSIDRDNGDREIYHYSTQMGFIRDGKFHQTSDGWGSVSDKQGIRKILRSLGQNKAIQEERLIDQLLDDERRLSTGSRIETDKQGRVIDSTGRLSSGSEAGTIKPVGEKNAKNKDLHIKRTDAKVSFRGAHRYGFEPTQQQRDIVDTGIDMLHGRVGTKVLSVQAAAGTGKTTTLKALAKALDNLFNLEIYDRNNARDQVEMKHKLAYLQERFGDDLKELGIKDITKVPYEQQLDAAQKLKERHGSKSLYYGVFNRNNQFEAERGFTGNTGVSTLDKLAFWGLRLGAADEVFGKHIGEKVRLAKQDVRPASMFTPDGKPVRKKNKRVKKDGTPISFSGTNYITGKSWTIEGENPVLEDYGLAELSKGEDFVRFFNLRDKYADPDKVPQGKQTKIPTNGHTQFSQFTVDDLGFLLSKAVENWAYSTDEEISAKHFAMTPQQISEKRNRKNKKKKKKVVATIKAKKDREAGESAFDEYEVDFLVDSEFFGKISEEPDKYIPKEWVELAKRSVQALTSEHIKDDNGKKVLSPIIPDQTQQYKLFAMSKPNLTEAKYMIGHLDGKTKKQAVYPEGKVGDWVDGNGKLLRVGKDGKFIGNVDPDDVWVVTSLKNYEAGKTKGKQQGVIQKSFANPARPLSGFLIDEAQDLNPVMMQILENNRENFPIILVGDSRQKVYGFRRAMDALQLINPDYVLPLNESFRFGNRIAYLANIVQMLGNIDDEEKAIPNFRMQYVTGHLQELVTKAFDRGIELLGKKDRDIEEDKELTDILMNLDDEFKFSKKLGPNKDGKDKNGELLSMLDSGMPDAAKLKILKENRDSSIEEAMGEIWDSEAVLPGEKEARGELLPTVGRSYAYLTRNNAEIFEAAPRLATHLDLQFQAENLGQESWKKRSVQIATSAKKHDELVKFYKHASWILSTPDYKMKHPDRRPEYSPLIGKIWTVDEVKKRLGQKKYNQMTAMWNLLFPIVNGKRVFKSPKQMLDLLMGYERDGSGGQKEWAEPLIVAERQALKLAGAFNNKIGDLVDFDARSIDEIANRKNAKKAFTAAAQKTSQLELFYISPVKQEGEIYAHLDIDGGNETKPGKWTGKIVITGWGLSTTRRKGIDGGTRKGGRYREDVKRILSSDPRFKDVFKFVPKGSKRQSALSKNPDDAYVIDIKDVGGSKEKLAQIVTEAATEIRKAMATNGADSVVTTAQLFKGMEADDVVLGKVWQDAFDSIDDILEGEKKITEAFREELNIVYVALTRAKKRIDPGRKLAELYLGTKGKDGERRRDSAEERLNELLTELRKSKNPEDQKLADALEKPEGFVFPYAEPEKPKKDDSGSKDGEITAEEMDEALKDSEGIEEEELNEIFGDKDKEDDEAEGESSEREDDEDYGDDEDKFDGNDGTSITNEDDGGIDYGEETEERLSSGKAEYWNNNFDNALSASAGEKSNERELNALLATLNKDISDEKDRVKPRFFAIENRNDNDNQDDLEIDTIDIAEDVEPETIQRLNRQIEKFGQAYNLAWAKKKLNNENSSPRELKASRQIIQDAKEGRLSSGSRPRRVIRTLEDVQQNMQVNWSEIGFRFTPNPEQQLVSDAAMTGEDIIIRALAGTGKTSALELLSRRIEKQDPDKKILYLTFTKKMTEEAKRKFADYPNVEVRTWDSVAYRVIVSPNKKLQDKYAGKGKDIIYSNAYLEIAEEYGLQEYDKSFPDKDGNMQRFTATEREQALILSETLRLFAISNSDNINSAMIYKAAGRYSVNLSDELKETLKQKARQMFDDSFNPDKRIQLSRNLVMKKFALMKPDLATGTGMDKNIEGNDILLFDEAQDANPVMTQIVLDQEGKLQRIIVGDSNQAIYEFRGAVDELEKFNAKYDLTLTESYRFGQEIAGFGNRFLSLHQTHKEMFTGSAPKSAKLRLTGSGPAGKVLNSENELPEGIQFAKNRKVDKNGKRETFAYLSNTNAAAYVRIEEAQTKGLRTGSVKTFKEDLTAMVDHAEWLKNGADKKNPPKQRFAPFNEFYSWPQLVKALDKALASEGNETSSQNVQAETAYKLMKERNFNFAGMREVIAKIETIDPAEFDDTPVVKNEIVDGATFEILSEGAMIARIAGNEVLLNFTDKGQWSTFMTYKPIFNGKLGFKYRKEPEPTWYLKFDNPEKAAKAITEIKQIMKNGLADDKGVSSFDVINKFQSFIDSGFAPDVLSVAETKKKYDLSITKSPNGKLKAAIGGGNTYVIRDQLKAVTLDGKRVVRWDGDANSWTIEADSPEEMMKKVQALRQTFGVPTRKEGESSWIVPPQQKAEELDLIDIVAQTAHRSKGLEYDYVVLGEDFKVPEGYEEFEKNPELFVRTQIAKNNEIKPEDVSEEEVQNLLNDPDKLKDMLIDAFLGQIEEQDLRLQYVAATRAKKSIVPGALGWVFNFTDEKDTLSKPEQKTPKARRARKIAKASGENSGNDNFARRYVEEQEQMMDFGRSTNDSQFGGDRLSSGSQEFGGRRERRIRRAGGDERLSSGRRRDPDDNDSAENRNTEKQSATQSRLDGFDGEDEQIQNAIGVWSRARDRGWPFDTSITSPDGNLRMTAINLAMDKIGERFEQKRGKAKIGSTKTNNKETATPETWMLPVSRLAQMIRVVDPRAQGGSRDLTRRELAKMLGIKDRNSLSAFESKEDAAISFNDAMNLIAEIGNQPEVPFWRLFSPTTPDEVDYVGEDSTLERFVENANRSKMRQRFMIEAFGKDAYPQWSNDGEIISSDDFAKMEDTPERFKIQGVWPDTGKSYKDADQDLAVEGYDPETQAIESARVPLKTGPQKTERKDFKLEELLDSLGIDQNDTKWPQKLQEAINVGKKKMNMDTELEAPSEKSAQRWRRDGVPTSVINELINLGVIKDAKSTFKSNNSGERLDYELTRAKPVVYEALNNFISERFKDSELNSTRTREAILGKNDVFQTLSLAAKQKGIKFSKLKGDEPRFGQDEMQSFVNRFNELFGTNFTIDDIFSDEQLRQAKERIKAGNVVTVGRQRTKLKDDDASN